MTGKPFKLNGVQKILLGIYLLFSAFFPGEVTGREQSLPDLLANTRSSEEILRQKARTLSAYDFTIHRFHSQITIREDSSFIVKETIRVEFHRPRHGIYREIPYQFKDELGKAMETPIRIQSVTDQAGKKWKYRITKQGPNLHIRIGNPKKTILGDQTFCLSYRVENAVLFLEDHDELYWNVTGNNWNTPILETYAEVTLLGRKPGRQAWAACYTGPIGSKESVCDFDAFTDHAAFYSRKVLNPGEGLTIAFGWDKGLVAQPTPFKRVLWDLNPSENWIFVLPFLTLGFMIHRWSRVGRDPRVREAVIVRYEPPVYNNIPLNPAEAGTLLDEVLDSRDITAAMVGLAVKGFLKIEERKTKRLIFDATDYYIDKVKDPDSRLSAFETALMNSLFTGGIPGVLISDLKNKFYTHLPYLKSILYNDLVQKKFFSQRPDFTRNLYLFAGLGLMGIGVMFSLFLAPHWAIPEIKGVIASILIGLPVMGFFKIMPAKTRSGALAYLETLGFQEFLNRAEKDRLERMGDKTLFSKYLPYALSLDVAENWAKAFEGIYQEPPDWYVSPGGFGTFNPSGFSRTIGTAASSLATAMVSAPRGSGGGSGGGGSSGGGFGGGGGGSW